MLFVGKMLKKDLQEVSSMSMSEVKLWIAFSELYNKKDDDEGKVDILNSPAGLGYGKS